MMIALHVKGTRTDENEFNAVTFDDDKLIKVSEVLEDYIDLGELIKYIVSKNLTKPFWVKLIKHLLNIDEADRVYDEDWVYQNIEVIQSKIFENDEIFNFILEFERFMIHDHLPDFSKLSIWWFTNMTEESLTKHQSFSNTLESYYKWIENRDATWWVERLTNPKSLTIKCSNAIFDKGIEDSAKVINTELERAVELVLVAIASGDSVIPNNQLLFLKNHYHQMSRGVLRRIADTCLDHLLEHAHIDAKILNQLDDFVFTYSGKFTKKEKSEEIKRKIIITAYQENRQLYDKLVFSYTKQFIQIMKHDDDLAVEIKGFLQAFKEELTDPNDERAIKIEQVLQEVGIQDKEKQQVTKL